MNYASIASSEFPRFQESVRAQWFPVYLEPVMGSAERFIIAVAAVSGHDWHVEGANALSRLDCLYGEGNGALIAEAARSVISHLKHDLAVSPMAVLRDWLPPISGAEIGSVSKGEGASLYHIASSWMRAMSSLYDRHEQAIAMTDDSDIAVVSGATTDRLPGLVYEYLHTVEPSLARNFRSDLFDERRRRNFEVSIDFTGNAVVANFGTLRAGKPAASVDFIKKRLWDLKVSRDKEGGLAPRQHEMLIQIPAQHDPQISTRQYDALRQARDALEVQADQEHLRLETFVTVESIGERLLGFERTLLA